MYFLICFIVALVTMFLAHQIYLEDDGLDDDDYMPDGWMLSLLTIQVIFNWIALIVLFLFDAKDDEGFNIGLVFSCAISAITNGFVYAYVAGWFVC